MELTTQALSPGGAATVAIESEAWEQAFQVIMERLVGEYQEVLTQLLERGYDEYITELKVRKTAAELASASRELYMTALEMTRPTTRIYASEDWLKCDFCAFRDPCIAKNRGQNYQAILNASYRPRTNDPIVEGAVEITNEVL